jgi:hypothetical protein
MKNSNKPDLRKWYNKKRFLLPMIFLALAVITNIISVYNDGVAKEEKMAEVLGPNDSLIVSESSIKTETVDEFLAKEEAKEAIKTKELRFKIKREIEALAKDDDLTDPKINSMDGLTITLAVLKYYESIIKEARASKDPDLLKDLKLFENKIVDVQKKNYPKLRKAYYEIVRPKVWENDIYVSVSGEKSTILTLRGGIFAANKNKKEMQTQISDIVTMLRFKEVQYPWYEGQDDFTYYEVKSPNDNEIVFD